LTGHRALAPATLIDRLTSLPPGVMRQRLGEFPVRGKKRPLELDALELEAATPSIWSETAGLA
jgi:hypothetical protein